MLRRSFRTGADAPSRCTFVLCLIGLFLGSSSCRSSASYSQECQRLDQALRDLEEGQLKRAGKRLERLLMDTQGDASDHVLQRFHAACLLTLLHARASVGPETGGPSFLMESKGPSLFDAEPEGVSIVGHLVATRFYADYAGLWAAAAAKAPSEVDGVTLLPPALVEPTVAKASRRTSYLVLYVLSRLHFDQRLASLLENERSLADFDTVQGDLVEVAVPDEVRPWILLALFRHLRQDNPERALPFGLTAFQSGAGSLSAEDRQRFDALTEWLLHPGEGLAFLCPTGDGARLDPDRSVCETCGEARSIDFRLGRSKAGD